MGHLGYRPRYLLLALVASVLIISWALFFQFRLNLANTWMVRSQLEQSPEQSVQAQTWLEQFSGTPVAAQAARSALKLAVLEGRMQDGVQAGERFLVLQPVADPITSHFLGLAYWGLGRKQDARTIWETSGNLPHYLARLFMQGWEAMAAGKPDQAIASFRQGVAYDPSWVEGISALAGYHWQMEEYAQAVPYLKTLVDLLPPNNPAQKFARARLALADGDVATAKTLFCQTWEQEAKAEYLQGCLWGLRQMGDSAAALTLLRSAVTLFPDQVAAEAQYWAEQLLQLGDSDEAALFFALACTVSPQISTACFQ